MKHVQTLLTPDNIDRAEVVIDHIRSGLLTPQAGIPTAKNLLKGRAPAGRSEDKKVLQAEVAELEATCL